MYDQNNSERPSIDFNRLESSYNSQASIDNTYYPPERPPGVTLIAIWQFIGAGLLALVVLFALSLTGDREAGSVAGILACVYGIFIPIDIAIGVGMWQLKSWARTLFIVLAILGLVLKVFSNSLTAADVVGIVLNLAAIIYLFQPSVRDLFERA